MKNSFTFIVLFFLLLILGYLFFMNVGKEQIPVVSSIPAQSSPNVNYSEDYKRLDEIAMAFPSLAKDFDNAPPFMIKHVWVQGDDSYVEYQNSKGELGQILIVKDIKGVYKAKGKFVASENGWDLVKGEGNLVSPQSILYERDNNKWVKKN